MELGTCFVWRLNLTSPWSGVWSPHPPPLCCWEWQVGLVPRSLLTSPAQNRNCMGQPLAEHQSMVQGAVNFARQASIPVLLEPASPQAVTEPRTGSQRTSWLPTLFSRAEILSSGTLYLHQAEPL